MQIPINVPLISNPYNWIIVLLMVLIAGYGLAVIFHGPVAQNQGT